MMTQQQLALRLFTLMSVVTLGILGALVETRRSLAP